MNESLISPFNITHPTTVQTSLFALASFARFDPTGRYVATARVDGTAAIWDLDTRAAVRILDGHVKAVSSIDWSRHSRYLLTASKGLEPSTCVPAQRCTTLRFDAPVVSASFHPRNSRIILTLMSTGEAYLVDQRKTHRARVELCEVQEESDEEGAGTSNRTRSAITGNISFIGTSAGYILVFNTHTKTMVARHKITGAARKARVTRRRQAARIQFRRSHTTTIHRSRRTRPQVQTTSTLSHELEPTHRFNDPINKTAWHAMSYSAADTATHKIYIWDISNEGQFANALDGGREPLLHLHWHPSKSSIASTTNQGNILIWHCPHPERWGAFAGGFEELDENEDEADMIRRKMKEEEEEVDIETVPEAAKPREIQLHGVQPGDEDLAWADDEPDDDQKPISLRVIMEEDWDI
ncbi:COMPASS complex protein [Mycena filopes]|nr:COMPASS complex protein [Mycena filopes]